MILFGRHVVALFISADAANAAEALSVAYDYLGRHEHVFAVRLCAAHLPLGSAGHGLYDRAHALRSDRVRRPCGGIAAADQGHR